MLIHLFLITLELFLYVVTIRSLLNNTRVMNMISRELTQSFDVANKLFEIYDFCKDDSLEFEVIKANFYDLVIENKHQEAMEFLSDVHSHITELNHNG